MKSLITSCISLLFFGFSHAQQQDEIVHINFSIVIDGEFVITGISKGIIIFSDSAKQTVDSAAFRYEAGDMKLNSEDFKKILAIGNKIELKLRFNFMRVDPDNITYPYVFHWIGPLLSNRYIVFNIGTSLNKRRNKRLKEGDKYLAKVYIPGYRVILPKQNFERVR